MCSFSFFGGTFFDIDLINLICVLHMCAHMPAQCRKVQCVQRGCVPAPLCTAVYVCRTCGVMEERFCGRRGGGGVVGARSCKCGRLCVREGGRVRQERGGGGGLDVARCRHKAIDSKHTLRV